MPVAILKPHWKNALGVLWLRHDGVLTETERRYLEYLKRVWYGGPGWKALLCSKIRELFFYTGYALVRIFC